VPFVAFVFFVAFVAFALPFEDGCRRSRYDEPVREAWIRAGGVGVSVAYATLIAWLYIQQPQTAAEVTGGLSATVGAYQIDERSFDDGLRLFRKDEFAAARSAFERADRARRDARTQFYIAYSFYREGWGRTYHDDDLYRQGAQALARAIDLAPQGRLVVEDANLGLPSADQLRAEFEAGLRRDAADFNPLRLFDSRK
jgi:hypothetical protein